MQSIEAAAATTTTALLLYRVHIIQRALRLTLERNEVAQPRSDAFPLIARLVWSAMATPRPRWTWPAPAGCSPAGAVRN